jgi:hypothetical protein
VNILGKLGVRMILPVQTAGPHVEADCTPFSFDQFSAEFEGEPEQASI